MNLSVKNIILMDHSQCCQYCKLPLKTSSELDQKAHSICLNEINSFQTFLSSLEPILQLDFSDFKIFMAKFDYSVIKSLDQQSQKVALLSNYLQTKNYSFMITISIISRFFLYEGI